VYLVGFATEIYYDARFYERQPLGGVSLYRATVRHEGAVGYLPTRRAIGICMFFAV